MDTRQILCTPHTKTTPDTLRPVFFCGGSGLNGFAPELARHTHKAVYLVTPFDSGGSSAALRAAFDIPAIGDLRARLLSLADVDCEDIARLCALCNLRLTQQPNSVLLPLVWRMALGLHPLVRELPHPMRTLVCDHLRALYTAMPPSLELAGACIGNLALVGGYLAAGRAFEPVLDAWTHLLNAHGQVLPVVAGCAHLNVRLKDGTIICGQHRFTGKESAAIASPICDIWLTDAAGTTGPSGTPDRGDRGDRENARNTTKNTGALVASITPHLSQMIREADLICYPVGSFYSSVVASLLPVGVGRAVADAVCPKVFVPNTGEDPELIGHSLRDQIERLLACLGTDCPPDTPANALLDCVLLDTTLAHANAYAGGVPHDWLQAQGIRVITAPLVSPSCAPYVEPVALCASLLEIMLMATP